MLFVEVVESKAKGQPSTGRDGAELKEVSWDEVRKMHIAKGYHSDPNEVYCMLWLFSLLRMLACGSTEPTLYKIVFAYSLR